MKIFETFERSCYTFLAQTIYTWLKTRPLKWKFLRLSSAQVKICEISSVNFEATRRFLSKFCISFQVHERLFLCTFLVQRIYTSLKRSPLTGKFFEIFEWSGQILWKSFCKFWKEESIPLHILYPSSSSMKDYSSVLS